MESRRSPTRPFAWRVTSEPRRAPSSNRSLGVELAEGRDLVCKNYKVDWFLVLLANIRDFT